MRSGQKNKGKSGGLRVIYYCISDADQIVVLTIYAKAIRDDLDQREIAILKALAQDL